MENETTLPMVITHPSLDPPPLWRLKHSSSKALSTYSPLSSLCIRMCEKSEQLDALPFYLFMAHQ